MTTASESQVDDLIAELRQAQQARRAARNWMTLLIALTVAVFVFLGFRSLTTFEEEEAEALGIALAEEVGLVAPVILEELNHATNRLLPAYEKAFVDTFTENQERYLVVLSDEYVALEIFAQSQWPLIEEQMAVLVLKQQETAEAALSRYIDEEQLVDLSDTYGEALEAYFEKSFETNYNEHIALTASIVDSLNQIATTQVNLPPDNSQFTIGMMLELLGLEMQANVMDNR